MRFERRISDVHVAALEQAFGDLNPLHADPVAARAAGFERPIAQGALLVCLLSELIGNHLGVVTPVFCGLEISFEHPVYVGDRLTFDLEPRHHSAALGTTDYGFAVLRAGLRVARGRFLVKAPLAATARRPTPVQ